MKKNLKFEVIKKINLLTFFFFFYTSVSINFPIPTFLKTNNNAEIQNSRQRLNEEDSFEDFNSFGEMLEEKINTDLFLHNMQLLNKKTTITQFTLNKEGKILGYKPHKLTQLNYLLEKPLNILVKKEAIFINQYSNIYWLNLKLR